MSSAGVEKKLQDGEFLFRENEVGHEMYLIKEGRIKITKAIGDKTKVLAILTEGDFFGEMALLDSNPRSANAVADGDASVIVFDTESFMNKVSEDPLVFYVLTELTKRLRRADEQIKLLMIKNDEQRFVSYIEGLCRESGVETEVGIVIEKSYAPYMMSETISITKEQVEEYIKNMGKANVLKISEEGKIIVRSLGAIEEYRKFLSLKEKFGGEN